MNLAEGAARDTDPVIWAGVPARNKNFTGRGDILELLSTGASSSVTAVVQHPKNPLPQAVQGLGGVGKTAIAIEYAHRFKSQYDLVWWIPADQLPSVRGSLSALATRLHLDPTTATGIDGAIDAVLDALGRGDPYSRWLLIFDNADKPDDIQRLIPRIPGDGLGKVLITSRNPDWESVINTVPMDVFIREESTEFLRKRVPAGLSKADADRLADELGDLPLALEQAGAMLSETGMPVEEYLRLLDEHVSKIMEEGKAQDYPHSMTAAWKLSVAALEQRLPQALELLRCCAFFGPEPIPGDVLRRGVRPTGSAVSKVIGNPTRLSSAIHELDRYALVTLDGSSIAVHRLIQKLLRDELTEEQRASYRQEAHLILATGAPTNPDDVRSWQRFNEILPHVNSDSTELAKSGDPSVRDLARNIMRYLYQAGDYASVVTLTERFVEQWTKDSGPENPDVLRAQRHQGNVLRVLGRYPESYKVTEEALRSCRSKLGESDPTTLSLRTSFGADLRARGQFAAARELDEESRVMQESAYGPDDSRSLRLLASVALDYGLNSKYAQATEFYQDALQRMQSSLDSTANDVLAAWVGLSWTLRLLGNFREAYDVIWDARHYGQTQEGLGPDHLGTLRSVIAYTVVCRRLPERRLEALELGRTTLDLLSRRFGDGHPDTLGMAVSVSNLLRSISEDHHAEALVLAESTMQRYPSVYGDDHPYNLGCVGNVALLKRMTGDADRACVLDERALAGLQAALGPNHHFTLTVAVNYASDFAKLGDHRQARRLGEETLPRLTKLLGADHPHTLASANNLSLDLIATGAEEEGSLLQAKTLRRHEKTQGPNFPDTLVARAGGRLDPDFDPLPI